MQLLLVHGLGRTPRSLFGLAAALRRRGHHTRFFGYLPSCESLPRICFRLAAVLHDLARLGHPVGLIGHSLGGLLLRMALPAVPELRVHLFAMLGTPQKPPRMARFAWRWFPPFRVVTRDCGRFLTSPAAFAALPALRVPFSVLAGTAGVRGRFSPFDKEPNDGFVAVEEARIPGAEAMLLPVFHTFMMDSVVVRDQISAIMSGDGCPSSLEQ